MTDYGTLGAIYCEEKRTCEGCPLEEDPNCCERIRKAAQRALKKQVEKPLHKIGYCKDCAEFLCDCGNIISIRVVNSENGKRKLLNYNILYCSRCGQKIDWSNVN